MLGACSTTPTPKHVDDTEHRRLWAVERDGSESDAAIATVLTAATHEAWETTVSVSDEEERAEEKVAAVRASELLRVDSGLIERES